MMHAAFITVPCVLPAKYNLLKRIALVEWKTKSGVTESSSGDHEYVFQFITIHPIQNISFRGSQPHGGAKGKARE